MYTKSQPEIIFRNSMSKNSSALYLCLIWWIFKCNKRAGLIVWLLRYSNNCSSHNVVGFQLCHWCHPVLFAPAGVPIFSFLSKISETGEFDWKILENDCRIKRDNRDWLSKNKLDRFSCAGPVWSSTPDIPRSAVRTENLFSHIGQEESFIR